MSDSETKPEDSQHLPQEDAASPQDDGAQRDVSPQELLERVQAERDDLESRLLRMAADYQNYVRRSQQTAQGERQQQAFEMAKALLTVLDHFDHAMAVDPQKASAQTLLAGVQIVRDELMKVLEGFGVQRFEAGPGDKFDPMCHEAMMRVTNDPQAEPGHVVAQFQPGYLLGERTLRPAKVSVAGDPETSES